MKFIAILAVLVCCILMFCLKRSYKVAILFMSTMLFTAIYIPAVPIHTGVLLIVISFLVSELEHIRVLYKKSKGNIVYKLMGISILASIITIIFSPHLRDIDSIRVLIQNDLFIKDFALIYAFWCFTDEKSFKPTIKITFWSFIVLTFFGIINYLTKEAAFVSAAAEGINTTGMHLGGNDIGNAFTYSDRFRVQAMFMNPFDYGYICIIILLLHIYGYSRKEESKIRLAIIIICSLFGVLTCGSRTVLFCLFVGVSVYILLAFKPSKTLKFGFVALLLFSLSYQFVPFLNDQVNSMLTMFDKNTSYDGSSIEMRSLQYAAVFYHIQDSPIVGKGYGYFSIDMGWGQGDRSSLVDKDLWGLEGVVMSKLLERGFLGLALYLIFYISLIVYFIKNRKLSKPICSLGLALLMTYLSFANMTGELSSVFPTLLGIGYCVSAIEYKKKKL